MAEPEALQDLRSIELSAKPNQCFVAPERYGNARPHRMSGEYPVDASTLYDLLRDTALGEPRVSMLAEERERLRADLCQRTALFRFPDDVSVEVMPLGEGRSTLVMYSRARYGYSDFGVNRRRVNRWLAALDERIARRASRANGDS